MLEEQLKGKQVCSIATIGNAAFPLSSLTLFCSVENLTNLQKDKEDLEEVSTELELADEDELVP